MFFSAKPFRSRDIASFVIPLLASTLGQAALAQDELSLNDLLELKVTVATKTERSLAQAPSSITVITKDDIARNMCRDMVDVINMIPGLSVTKDFDWDLGLGARGVYGFEGRSLIMVDGMQVSGLYFGSFLFGNELPVQQVERIEVIRGPGSVLYGGIAELAVINVITIDAAKATSGKVVVRQGQLGKDPGHRDLAVQYNKAASSDSPLRYSLTASAGDAVASNSKYEFFAMEDKPLTADRNSQRMTDHYTAGGSIAYGNTEARVFLNQYRQTHNAYTAFSENPSFYDEINYNAKLEHKFDINDKISVSPYLDYQYSLDWKYDGKTVRDIARQKAGVNGLYRTDSVEFLVGGEYFVDHAKIVKNEKDEDSDSKGFYKDRKDTALRKSIDVANNAVFAGATYFWSDYSAVAGIRYDSNEIYGSASSPRFGLTGKFGALNSKVIYSEAFRAPLIGNNAYSQYGIDPNKSWREDVIPEKTKVWELELAYKITDRFLVTTNIYDQKIDKVIEFFFNPDVGDLDEEGNYQGDTYSKNGGSMGTRGIEAEFKYLGNSYRATFNFSKSQLTADTAASYIAAHRKVTLGIPDTKAYLNFSYSLDSKYALNFNQIYIGPVANEEADRVTKDLPAQNLTDLGLQLKKTESGFEGSLNVHDLFDKGQEIATAYYTDGYTGKFRWKGREVALNAAWNF